MIIYDIHQVRGFATALVRIFFSPKQLGDDLIEVETNNHGGHSTYSDGWRRQDYWPVCQDTKWFVLLLQYSFNFYVRCFNHVNTDIIREQLFIVVWLVHMGSTWLPRECSTTCVDWQDQTSNLEFKNKPNFQLFNVLDSFSLHKTVFNLHLFIDKSSNFIVYDRGGGVK